MRRATVRQNDFCFGEMSPDHAAAGDRDAVSRSLKKGRNVRILNSYGIAQRFGSRRLHKLTTGEHVLARDSLVVSDGTKYIAAFLVDRLKVLDQDGVVLHVITGLPYANLDEVREATTWCRLNQIYIAHQSYPTQVFTYDPGTDTWTRADYAFADGVAGSLLQIYYRYAAKGITIQPSALTGSVTLTASDDAFVAAHVGVIFRYGVFQGAGKGIRITAVTNARTATGDVLGQLPTTKQVTVEDGSNFVVGEEVKGLSSLATGFITGISGNDIQVLMTRGFDGFDDSKINDADHDGTNDTGEFLVGEFTRSYITQGTQADVTPAATVLWDEAAVSPVHGYPGCVFERAGRLGFTDFRDIPAGIALSAPDTADNFDVGTGSASDAIFVVMNESTQRILRAVPAANLLLLTSDSVYYVPEGTDIPLSFQTFTVVKIGPVGIAEDTNPAIVDEGVIYIGRGSKRIMGLLSTGSLTAPWRMVDLSSKSAHLISGPQTIAVTSGSTQAPERYVMVLNNDGSIAVLFFDESPARIGWVLWDTQGGEGQYTSICTLRGFLYTNCNRTVGGVAGSYLERLDADAQLDCSETFAVGDKVPELALATVMVNQGTNYLGEFVVQADGTIDGLPDSGPRFEAGFHFDMAVAIWPPEPEGDGRANFALRHIGRASVRVEDTQTFKFGIAAQAETLWATIPVYLPEDDEDADPPLRSTWFRRSFAGYLDEPNLRIVRHKPQPVKILAVVEEVAF